MKWFSPLSCMIILIVALIATNLMQSVLAKTIEARSESKFYQYLDKKKYTVALFYDEDRETRKNTEEKRNIRTLKSTVKNVSARPLYHYNDVQFIEVNRAKEDLCKVAQDFNVTKTPAVLLFEDQELVRNARAGVATLHGFASYQQLQSFIDDNLQDSINEYAEKRDEERKLERQERIATANYYGPYYYGSYCGWPYDYWSSPCWNYWGGGYGGCGGYGPSVGLGVSVWF